MTSSDTILGFLFLFQTGLGSLGNSFLLGLYSTTFFIGPRLRPTDLLLSHLALVNVLVLLSKGIPQTMAALGLNNFLDDIGCKLVLCIHRVARGLSLCTTCFLSGFQVITLSPRSSRWGEIKARIPKCIVPFCSLCWTFHLLTYCFVLLNVKAQTGIKNITESIDLIYCYATSDRSFTVTLYVFIISLPDILCVGIIVGTSGVFVLYRHHQRVQYIHGNNLTPSSSPETKATQTILLLVSMFVYFYSLNSIFALQLQFRKPTSWLVHISAFLAACFPACRPFVLIFSDSQVPKYSLALWDRIKLPFQ
ncbi:vomeronasal type-1 receptor 1-like [Petaurus breviceps papuanus]|uniref:vomeronasal type-1 receptor 1-like n=1 Tax=Petaurus breviceps papuanus TaxID=3040969 RepID=UPI0036DE9480